MREKVLEKIQKESQKKVMMNFNIDPYLKSLFEDACKFDGVTMSSALIAMIQTYIEETNTVKYSSIREEYEKVDKLVFEIKDFDTFKKHEQELLALRKSIHGYIEKYGVTVPCDDHTFMNEHQYVLGLDSRIMIIDSLLMGFKKDKK